MSRAKSLETTRGRVAQATCGDWSARWASLSHSSQSFGHVKGEFLPAIWLRKCRVQKLGPLESLPAARPRRWGVVAALLTGLLSSAACDSPTAPQPDALQASCPVPAVVDTQALAGATVVYSLPTASGGVPPYVTSCFPGSGTLFPVGQTAVSCGVRDAQQKQASCTFNVTVRLLMVPMLDKTLFLAFGDSITEGKVSESGLPIADLIPGESYPEKLQVLLRQTYPGQNIVVINRGSSGESIRGGSQRLPGVLDADRPQVLLLLEGINGLGGRSVSETADFLRAMVDTAKARGVDVMLVKLLPTFPPYNQDAGALVPPLNLEIEKIAMEKQIGQPVDAYNLFISSPSLMGPDGLHPTRAGYSAMAQLVLQHIVSRYDSAASGGMVP